MIWQNLCPSLRTELQSHKSLNIRGCLLNPVLCKWIYRWIYQHAAGQRYLHRPRQVMRAVTTTWWWTSWWSAGVKNTILPSDRSKVEFQDGSRVLWNRSSPSWSSEFAHKPTAKILFLWDQQKNTNCTYFIMTLTKTHRDVVGEAWLSWAGMLWLQASKGYARTSILPSLCELLQPGQPQHPRGASTVQKSFLFSGIPVAQGW